MREVLKLRSKSLWQVGHQGALVLYKDEIDSNLYHMNGKSMLMT